MFKQLWAYAKDRARLRLNKYRALAALREAHAIAAQYQGTRHSYLLATSDAYRSAFERYSLAVNSMDSIAKRVGAPSFNQYIGETIPGFFERLTFPKANFPGNGTSTLLDK